MKSIGMCLGLVFLGTLAIAADEVFPDDETITFWVGEALREDPRVWVGDIAVSTKDGVVRMSGIVSTLSQRQVASAIASKIRGVSKVLNQLEVERVALKDAEIEQQVLLHLKKISGAKLRDLKVTSEDGNLTLSGEAESAGLRAEAVDAASDVRGVLTVRNSILIRPASSRPDAEIVAEINQTLHRDVYLTGLPIDVSCVNGRVSLSGSVGNPYLKQRADTLALQTANVVEIKSTIQINRLQERGERRRATTPNNVELALAVEERLAANTQIDPIGIVVHVSSGHVTLRGYVPSMRQRQVAEMATLQVTGAVWVTNLISVRTPSRPDEEIKAELTELLGKDPALSGSNIEVVVVNGIVTLNGTVTSHYPKLRATDLAGRVAGVRSLTNSIDVRWRSMFRDPTLKQHIASRLHGNWETAPVMDRIQISVTDGNVILSGDIDTWAQRREAGRMAFITDGVRSVQNRLTIESVDYPWEQWNSDSKTEVPADWIHQHRGDFFERPGVTRS